MNIQEKCDEQRIILNDIFNSLKSSKTINKKYLSAFLFKKIQDIFSLEMEFYGLEYNRTSKKNADVDLLFITDYESKNAGTFSYKDIIKNNIVVGKLPTVEINMAYYLEGLSSSDRNQRLLACRGMLETLFHEIRHFRQHMLIDSNYSSKSNLRNAKEFALNRVSQDYQYVYENNHDSYAIESDADFNSLVKAMSISEYNAKKENIAKVKKCNRDMCTLVIEDSGRRLVVDRDEYIDGKIHDFIVNKKMTSLLSNNPYLLKEYNSDCTVKSLTELIDNMHLEIHEAEKIEDQKDKSIILDDTVEMYYELIYKRLKANDPFELFDAVNKYGKTEIYNLMRTINEYFIREKRRKLVLLSEKQEAEEDLFEGLVPIVHNNGFVIHRDKAISVDEYAKGINCFTDNQYIRMLLKSAAMKLRIPTYGFYILKDGSKISAKTFIESKLKPYLRSLESKKNYMSDMDEFLEENVVAQAQMDYLLSCERVNREYQEQRFTIDRLKNKNRLNALANFDFEEVYYYKEIISIANGGTSFLDSLINENDLSVLPLSEVDKIRLMNLKKYAIMLNRNTVFNPNKINYYKKLKRNDKYDILMSELTSSPVLRRV